MFPRALRLSRRRDIERVLKTGRRLSTPLMTVRHLPNGLAKPRVTVVVGTVVSKRAVARNRIKRQTRHELRQLLGGLQVGVDLMISLKPAILKTASQERQSSLRYLLERAGIIPHQRQK